MGDNKKPHKTNNNRLVFQKMYTQQVTDAVEALPRHARGGSSGGSDGSHVSWAVVGRVGRLFLPYWVSLMAVFGVLAANAFFDSLSACLFPFLPPPPRIFPSLAAMAPFVLAG